MRPSAAAANSIEFFRPDMRDDRSELLTLEQDLRRAIERNEIEVVYQPISRLSDMQLAGFEALVRWRHRTEGLLGPDVFMSVAEETGIIKELSHHVLNEASRQLGIWQRAFRPERPLFVSVNVSSSQLFNTDLVDEVRALLGREDISPGSLKLELTESLVMENPELSVEILERLKALGVGLACDDFGTGYSALASLRRLPFDILKVDRSFLEADPEDEKAIIILETVILLAHDLHMTVVAEGIESQEQITTLAELECDLGQGFLIGEPMSAKQVVEALGGGSFIATKPVFSGIWDKLSGRKPSEVAAPVPATIPAPAAAAEPVAEEAILPALGHRQGRARWRNAGFGPPETRAPHRRKVRAGRDGPTGGAPAGTSRRREASGACELQGHVHPSSARSPAAAPAAPAGGKCRSLCCAAPFHGSKTWECAFHLARHQAGYNADTDHPQDLSKKRAEGAKPA